MVWYWIRPAPAGQLPGFMTSLGYDASASLRFIVSLIVLPIVSTMIWKPLLDRLAQDDVQRWARNAAAISLLSALWISLLTKLVYWAAIPGAIGVLAAYAARHVRAEFRRRDVILLLALAPVWMALLDLTKLEYDQAFVVAVLAMMTIRVVLVFLRPGQWLHRLTKHGSAGCGLLQHVTPELAHRIRLLPV